jgi:putative membrane protein
MQEQREGSETAGAEEVEAMSVGSTGSEADPTAAGRVPWYQDGTDPDYRFSLANERTFLAWIRTALALIAAAVALRQLVPPFRIPGVRSALSVLLAGLGLAISATAYRHWLVCESAMRRQGSLPRSWLIPWLAATLAVAATAVTVVVLLGAH